MRSDPVFFFFRESDPVNPRPDPKPWLRCTAGFLLEIPRFSLSLSDRNWTRLFLEIGVHSSCSRGFNVTTNIHTICLRSSDPFNIVTYHIKWVTTSWTYSTSGVVRITFILYPNQISINWFTTLPANIRTCVVVRIISGIISRYPEVFIDIRQI